MLISSSIDFPMASTRNTTFLQPSIQRLDVFARKQFFEDIISIGQSLAGSFCKYSSFSTAAIALGRCAMTTIMHSLSAAALIAAVRLASPSASRLEFGSSSTIRKGHRRLWQARSFGVVHPREWLRHRLSVCHPSGSRVISVRACAS